MDNFSNEDYDVDILDENIHLSINEISQICNVHMEHITEMVAHGLISPIDDKLHPWHFSGNAVKRSLVTLRLQRDLNINLAGIALILDLMEEVEQLRQELKRL